MVSKIKLLVEGGLGGHMPHLYENGDLTFGELKDVFILASKGKLTGTEKTDGQNIKISFNVKTQEAVGGRNPDHYKNGGLNIEQMYDFFFSKEQKTENENLKYTFSDAIKIFQKAARLLDVETQIEVFGPEANNWYNAEIMDDRSPNVINYDTRSLLIHRTGHFSYDRKTDQKDFDPKFDKKAAKFMSFLEKVQKSISNKRHAILVNPIQNLKELNNKEALKVAIYKLENTMSKYKLSDDNTINDFLKAELNKNLQTNLSDDLKQTLINSAIGITPKIKKREIKKDLSKEVAQEIDRVIDSMPQLIKKAIKPIELIVTDFAAEMLQTLESAFIINNKEEVKRLINLVNSTVEQIRSKGSQADLDFLDNQLSKLKGVDTIKSAVEGFAFSYNGKLYKFTGKFAPVNQILGLLKYGRGSKKSDDGQDLQEVSTGQKKYDTALLGGGFKPPHKGHIELIKQLASKAENVIIYTSDKSSSSRTFNSGNLKGKVIDGKKCNEFLEKMIEQVPELSNVNVIITNTPLKEIFDYVEKTSTFAESILIGVGDKDEDSRRFDNISKYTPQEKKLKVDILPLSPVVFNGEPLSASRLREAISNGNLERVISFIPNEIFNKTEFAQEMIDAFMGEIKINEIEQQVFKLFTEDNLNEMSAMGAGAGAVAGHVASKGKKKMKISRKQFMEEMQLRKTIREALRLRQEKKKAQLNEEQILRQEIRNLIKEAKQDISYGNTGLNVLAAFLGGSFTKGITAEYKSLETKKSQRDTFRNKFLELSQKLFNEMDINIQGGEQADAESDADALEEEINVSIDGEEENKIIPAAITAAKGEKEKKPEEDENTDKAPIGIKKAVMYFNSWRDEIEKPYVSLDDPQDRKMFKDYFMANIPAILDVAEAEVSKQTKTVDTTPPEGAQVQQPAGEPPPDQEEPQPV